MWRITSCRLYATVYSIYSQRLSISVGRLFYPQSLQNQCDGVPYFSSQWTSYVIIHIHPRGPIARLILQLCTRRPEMHHIHRPLRPDGKLPCVWATERLRKFWRKKGLSPDIRKSSSVRIMPYSVPKGSKFVCHLSRSWASPLSPWRRRQNGKLAHWVFPQKTSRWAKTSGPTTISGGIATPHHTTRHDVNGVDLNMLTAQNKAE